MLRSMFSGLSGLTTSQIGLDVVGNNVANVNTVGYKASRVTFQNVLSQNLTGATAPMEGSTGGSNGMQVGLGSKIGSIDTITTQGNLQTTGNFTDLAIEGNGYFVLSSNGVDDYSYTRAGNLSFDSDGSLVYSNGFRVMGWQADDEGSINTASPLANVSIPSGVTVPSNATTSIDFGYNLDSNAYIEGQTVLRAGNSANISYIEGYWSGDDGASNIYDRVGVHTIQVVSSKVTGDKVTGSQFSNRFQTIRQYMTNQGLAISNFQDLDPSNNADLRVYSDAVSGTGYVDVSVNLDDSIEDVMEKINTQVSGVTATFIDGNIQLSRTVAGGNANVAVSDSYTSLGTGNFGVADILFGASTVSGFNDYRPSDSTAAHITWDYEPSSTTSPGFSVSGTATNALLFSADDTRIEGVDGVVITALDTGFEEGTLVVDSVEPETHASTTRIYDSLGNARNVTITYEKISDNTWTWTASGQGIGGNGEIYFTNQGEVNSITNNTISVLGLNGAASQSIEIDLNSISQYAGESSVASIDQDGYAQGSLESFSIDARGIIVGRFSNGMNRDLAQLAIANFNNASGLTSMGDSTYAESNNSGVAQIGIAGLNGRGDVATGTLEMSNVDISSEFANMIIYQRGFQANSKMITTGDEMLTTLVNLKR